MRPSTFSLAALSLLSACGRTELYSPPPEPPGPACRVDADCPGHEDLCKPVTCALIPEGDAGMVAR